MYEYSELKSKTLRSSETAFFSIDGGWLWDVREKRNYQK